MTNLQAALGLAQLEQLENFIVIKELNYKRYKKRIKRYRRFKTLHFKSELRTWFYSLFCESDKYGMNKDVVIKYLSDKKIQSRPIWGLIHEQKSYLNCQSYKIEKSKNYVNNIVNIPCSTNFTKDDVDYVVNCLRNNKKEW